MHPLCLIGYRDIATDKRNVKLLIINYIYIGFGSLILIVNYFNILVLGHPVALRGYSCLYAQK